MCMMDDACAEGVVVALSGMSLVWFVRMDRGLDHDVLQIGGGDA